MYLPITAMIPVRIDSQDRLENILTISRAIHEQWLVEKIIVVENDTEPRLLGLLRDRPYITYIFVQSVPGRAYSRTHSFNTALHYVSTPVVAAWDADVAISASQVRTAHDLIVAKKAIAVTPFNRFIHIPRRFLEDVRKGTLDFNVGDDPKNALYRIDAVIGQGVVFYSTPHLKHTRGLSELFEGWGCEDDEIIIRLSKLGYPIVKLVAPGLHVTHERTASGVPDPEGYKLNEGERQRIADMSKEEVLAYFGITERVGRYSEISRAEPYVKS